MINSSLSSIYYVWLRNLNVWRKLALPSLLGNVVDPIIALIAFGLGLGSFIAGVDGQPYINYLAVGAISIAVMNAATFESLYSAFCRMHVQKTWHAIRNTPVRLHEIVLGEWLWATTKSVMSGVAMMLILMILGIGDLHFWLLGLLALFFAGLMFSALGLCVNASSPGFDYFLFYFTLFITPQVFLSGAFFPRSTLPGWLNFIGDLLPLSLVVDLLRAIYESSWSKLPVLLLVLLFYCAIALFYAIRLTEKRFRSS